MTRTQKGKYDHLYHEPERTVTFHTEDPILRNITIQLPEPPPLNKIEGYGLPPHKQKYQRDVLPPKLQKLQNQKYSNVEEYWTEIAENYDYYEDELSFIEQAWEKRKKGLWVFINGTPTWIPPWCYYYTSWFEMDNDDGSGLAQYRDRDRKFFIMAHYCATTTEAWFKHKITTDKGNVRYTSMKSVFEEAKAKGYKIQSEGYMVDMGKRTLLGLNYPKLRREGATTKAESIMLEVISRLKNANGGIQSMTDTHGQTVFQKHLVTGFRGLPFFFLPVNPGNENPKSSVNFEPRITSGKGDPKEKKKRVDALFSQILFGPSSVGFFDTWKLRVAHMDEVGKSVEVNIKDRHYVVKKCLTLGAENIIVGLMINTSTVEQMDKGGANFRDLCKESHFEERNDTGQTLSGVINCFIPSDEGLEGFIDEFGGSKKEEAREHIMSIRRAFEERGDFEGLVKEIRRTPLTFSECFSTVSNNKRFDIYIINKRLNEFVLNDNPFCSYYKLEWVCRNPNHDYQLKKLPTIAEFVTGAAYVRAVQVSKEQDWDWEFSYLPDKSIANKFYIDDTGIVRPKNSHRFTCGVDMYKVNEKTTSGEGSKGSIAIYLRANAAIDNPMVHPMTIDLDTGDFVHKLRRFGGVYIKRPPDKNEFKEQALMAAVLFGMKVFPEINVPDIWDWFVDREFAGYLQHRIDKKTGKEVITPGATTVLNTKTLLFNRWYHFIKENGLREHHAVFLEQCRDIDDDMKDFDAFVAGGYALLADTEEAVDHRPMEEKVSELKYVEVFTH